LSWAIVKKLKKITYERGDKIYFDQDLAETIYFIQKGDVKIYAENDFYFAVYRSGDTFGDADVFCGTRRNGTA